MESVKKSINERAHHKRKYDNRVIVRQMQTIEDISSRSGNDAHADDADIRPIYDEEPMAENADQCHDTCPLPAKLTDNQTTELSNQSLESENIYVIETINIELEYKVAKLLKKNETLKRHYKELSDSIKTTRAKTIEHTTSLIAQHAEFKAQLQERGFAIAALKNELRKFIGNSMNTKISKPQFASQVDVNNDLSKPVTTHYLPKGKESACAKPHHMIAPGSSRWVPTGKIFTPSTTRVDSEPTNGSNEDITNQYEYKQTLNVSACTLNLSAAMHSDHNSSKLKIHDHSNEPSSSKQVPKVAPPADKTATSRQELELLFHHHIRMLRGSKTLSWKPCQGGSSKLNLPDHRLILAESDSLPHAHAQTKKTYYKYQYSRIKKAQVLKTKTSAYSDMKGNSLETKLQGRLLESFQEDTKYEHVG
ncbi:hypothetical protein Tco_0706855 [Tanacetum coccineum]|uniref:Uncharacterized protein n=1 Tax=Tanacetum coccineum TaxID=301880 RepID=A0ABQ4Y8J9_9ASTR